MTHSLEIRKLPDGGYVVGESHSWENMGQARGITRFASTSIAEALKYIEGKLTEVEGKAA